MKFYLFAIGWFLAVSSCTQEGHSASPDSGSQDSPVPSQQSAPAVKISGIKVVKKFPTRGHYVVRVEFSLSGPSSEGLIIRADGSAQSPSKTRPVEVRQLPMTPLSPLRVKAAETTPASLKVVASGPAPTIVAETHWPYEWITRGGADAQLALSVVSQDDSSHTINFRIPPPPPPSLPGR
jgi:hypothetical protein